MPRPILLTATLLAVFLWVGSTMAAGVAKADNNQESQPAAASEESETDIKPEVTSYVVQRGDYLEKIAKMHDINWPSIFELNESIENPDIIYPDQNLDIPAEDVVLTRTLPAETTMQVPDTYQPKVVAGSTKSTRKVWSTAKPLHAPVPTSITRSAGRHMGVGNALSFVGYPYRYGGSSPAGFDCSGFTQYIAAQQGISLPRTVIAQYNATQRISKGQLEPGDLVFFNAHHVAIYIGSGKVVHAATPSLGVRIDSLESMIAYNGYMGAGRI